MKILFDLKQALEKDLKFYESSCSPGEASMSKDMAETVISLRHAIAQATLASALRQSIESHVLAMPRLYWFERWFGVWVCPLKKRLIGTLSRPSFQLLPLLVAETQALSEANQRYRQEIDDLKRFQTDLQSMDIETLRKKINEMGQMEANIHALEKENHYLSAQLADMHAENQRLKAALQLEKAAKRTVRTPFDLQAPAVDEQVPEVPRGTVGDSLGATGLFSCALDDLVDTKLQGVQMVVS